MSDSIKLPASSYAELKKFIQCYFIAANGQIDKPINYETAAAQGAIQKTTLSANNGFFLTFGLLTNPKRGMFALTKHGRDIALSINNKEYELEIALRNWIRSNSFLRQILNAIKVRQGFDIENLKSFIIVSSGAKRNKNSIAGANAILDILKQSGLIRFDGSRITIEESIYNDVNEDIHSSQSSEIKSADSKTIGQPDSFAEQHSSFSTSTSYPNVSIEVQYIFDPSTADDFLSFLEKINTTHNSDS